MSNYKIVTDSTCDMHSNYYAHNSIDVVKLSFNINGKDYSDGDISFKSFYDMVRGGNIPVTGQVNPNQFVSVFEPVLKNGQDILYIGFSSALSGTYNSSLIAREELQEKYPDRKIGIVSSLCASLGEGMLLWYANENKNKGLSLEDNINWLEENKLKINHWFTVDDLNHLQRGGRVSKTAAVVGSLLGIKPILHVDDEGKLIPVSKVRGRAAAIAELVKKMKEMSVNPKDQPVFISHGDCEMDAELLKGLIEKEFGTKNFIINFVGAAIGSHSGPGTLALFFIGKNR